MPRGVTVICGPARSGKTERLLKRYRTALTGGIGRGLWLAPTQRAANEIRDRLLGPELDACFQPGVMTFARFAESVLAASNLEVRPISPQIKRQLVRRLIAAAHESGKLEYFGPIAETDGLVDLVTGWISELKRLEIWPEEYAKACRARGMTPKDRALVKLYEAYQLVLLKHQLYDPEGRFWSAREQLRAGQRRPVERVELVIVDGFTDFTRTQLEILESLASFIPEMLVTLPLEPQPRRNDLFAKPLATLAALQKSLRKVAVEQIDRPATSHWPTLTHIERDLFKSPHDQTKHDPAERVEILAASRRLGEIEAVGRRIKELMLHEGVRPGEIAVVFRSLNEAAPLVREAFDELGIPLAIEATQSLSAAPALRALAALVRLHVDDWPFRDLLALLGNNYFQPAWPGIDLRRASLAAERLIRLLQVPSGRRELLEKVTYWAGQARVDVTSEFDSPESEIADWRRERAELARAAHPLLERLAAAFATLPSKATQQQWGEAFETLARETGLVAAIGDDMLDTLAWRRCHEALAAGDQLSIWLGEQPPKITGHAAYRLLTDLLQTEPLPRERDELGRVRVLSAPSARAIDVPYLFVAGLSEKSFPRPDRDGGLYSDDEIGRLIQEELPLVDRTARGQEEMLLFYEVITRPSRRLFFSYPALDDAGQALSPSSYLLEIERACKGGVVPNTEELNLDPVPRYKPLSPRQWRVSAMAEALDGNTAPLAGLLAHEPVAGLAGNLLAGLRVTHSRQRGEGFGPFEGILESAAVRAKLAERFGPDRRWSASQLEQFAYCPFQFFLDRVLRFKPLEELELSIDYLRRGSLLHNALAHVHRELNDAGLPASPASLAFDEFERRFAAALDHFEPPPTVLDFDAAQREIDRRLLVKWSRLYYEQHTAYDNSLTDCDAPPRPTHFEVRFGQSRKSDETMPDDPLSSDEPLVLDLGSELLRIAGRIDRIDVGNVSGQRVFNVFDYKSSAPKSLKLADIEDGTHLQLPIYALAAQKLLADQGVLPWRAGYWFVRDGGFTEKRSLVMAAAQAALMEPTRDWISLQKKVVERVGAMIADLRHGAFPMHSADENCTGRCAFHTVCRVNQIRSLEKRWPNPQEASP